MPHPGIVTATPDPSARPGSESSSDSGAGPIPELPPPSDPVFPAPQPSYGDRSPAAGAAWGPPTGPPVDVAPATGPDADAAQAKKRPVWPAIWGAVAAVVIVLGLLAGDWAIRTYEMSVLLNRIEASESVMISTQEQMGALRVPDDPSQAERDRAKQMLESIAAEGREAVASAGREVAGVSFLPWHSSLIEAQDGYLAHNQAWVDYLERGSKDVTVLLSDDSAIESTWTASEKQVRAAMPSPSWAPLTDRVERIFTDEPVDDGGGDDGLRT